MRTPRLIIIVTFFFTCLTLTFLSIRSSSSDPALVQSETTHGFRSLFSFSAPLSLFPPNAIISLTDDNTTSFLARPAAFGPLLPAKGLSGQLWIGSGFGDDALRQGIINAEAEGELGCSDVPGWIDGRKKHGIADDTFLGNKKSKGNTGKSKVQRRSEGTVPVVDKDAVLDDDSESLDNTRVDVNDGTDDYLHSGIKNPEAIKSAKYGKLHADSSAGIETGHADIQSIQEGAEISGKVVLLSRGGCGFLEKVKWVQRRGGIALIVGDNTRGGPLIQMYARGDTSNVTIPSVFTSYTTAHLLSSLIPPEIPTEDAIDENGEPVVKARKKKTKKTGKKTSKHVVPPKSTSTSVKAKATVKPQSKVNTESGSPNDQASNTPVSKSSWFGSIFSSPGKLDSATDDSQTPKGSKSDWILVDDWEEEDENFRHFPIKHTSKNTLKTPAQNKKGALDTTLKDGFVIGVQDWRDPDLIDTPAVEDESKVSKTSSKATSKEKSNNAGKQSKISSKKPGAEALELAGKKELDATGGSTIQGSDNQGSESTAAQGDKSGILTRIFGDDSDESQDIPFNYASSSDGSGSGSDQDSDDDADEDEEEEHEGLWVTLTQTSGASPFFDTLLVLVVSPLITLTVVYALLLLRSRIRRRRWRAPKSVVERLPVRTYQTVASSAVQSRLPSPTSSSPTTPLLQGAGSTRPRPRSRTTSGIPEPGNLSRSNSDTLLSPKAPSRNHEHEKSTGSTSSEWKKYMGKQVECVVCLEEYIDGVSQVMSLPCGHEFHVDCITPWLTTRRRTCPICKGDVVRSLARGSSSSPRYEPYTDDDSDEDIQSRAAQTVNESPSSALPIARNLESADDMDIERGILSPTASRASRSNAGAASSWRSFLLSPISLPVLGQINRPRSAGSEEEELVEEDRSR